MFCARSRPTNKGNREQKPITKKLAEFLNQFVLLTMTLLIGLHKTAYKIRHIFWTLFLNLKVCVDGNYINQQTVFSCCRTFDYNHFKPIVHIAPISAQESQAVHLVAITQTGKLLLYCKCRKILKGTIVLDGETRDIYLLNTKQWILNFW